jgi:hypothetical protein
MEFGCGSILCLVGDESAVDMSEAFEKKTKAECETRSWEGVLLRG